LKVAEEALKKNHDWHIQNDEYGGYPEYDLCECNMKTLSTVQSVLKEK